MPHGTVTDRVIEGPVAAVRSEPFHSVTSIPASRNCGFSDDSGAPDACTTTGAFRTRGCRPELVNHGITQSVPALEATTSTLQALGLELPGVRRDP
jgi:hypothetical protein